MTNIEKFIEMMNKTFDAGFTKDNMKLMGSPCGTLKKSEYACDMYDCDRCKEWWHREYIPPKQKE